MGLTSLSVFIIPASRQNSNILSVILRGFLLCQRDMRTIFLYNKPKNEILICENEKISHVALIKRIIEDIIIDRRCNEYAVVFQSKELPVFPG